VPEGYNEKHVIAALQIASGYDDTQIDMVYFFPALQRLDGKQIGALAAATIDESLSAMVASPHVD
jgi:hypothetical protein